MIAGEHAVLHDKHALVASVNQRVAVTLQPRDDSTILIHSALGERKMSVDAIDSSPPFHFLGAVIQKHQASYQQGFELTVTADFPADIGLGSSSAVTVATLAAIETWLTGSFPDKTPLMQDAVAIIREVQGMGSGADVAATVWGGILLYKATPEVIARHVALPPISLVYVGYKTPTPDVIRLVEAARKDSPDGFQALFNRMETCVLFANAALVAEDWVALGSALNAGQQLMAELGVTDDGLSDIVKTMKSMPGIRGAKISGSGLGDCVLGIGSLDTVDWPYRSIPVALSPDGARLERSKA